MSMKEFGFDFDSFGNLIEKGSNVVDVAGKIGNVANALEKGNKIAEGVAKTSKFNNTMQGIGAGVNAAAQTIGTITSIVGMVENQKAIKKQQEMAQKQYNMELKKLQQQELNENKLAATIDKTWGGDGKIANTIDYASHAGDAGKSGLHGTNQDHGYITSRDETNTINNNTPTMHNEQAIAPVGYSESLNNKDQPFIDENDEDAKAG